MKIGRKLREVQASAIIIFDERCYSACVFILAGATQRLIGGDIGIHRPYSTRIGYIPIAQTEREYRRLMHDAKAYLVEMNLPESLYEAMVRVSPEQIRVLGPEELASYGLNRPDPVFEERRDSEHAAQYGVTKQEYLRRKLLSQQLCLARMQKDEDAPAYFACDERVSRTGH